MNIAILLTSDTELAERGGHVGYLEKDRLRIADDGGTRA